MNIKEFEKVYCEDIIAHYNNASRLLTSEGFIYDDEVIDTHGNKIKVVYTQQGTEIPIDEILLRDKKDFMKAYPSFDALDLYTAYMSHIKQYDGEEALLMYRKRMEEEQAKLDKYDALKGVEEEWNLG